MRRPIFTGVATAIVTPFNEGTVDFAVIEPAAGSRSLPPGIDAHCRLRNDRRRRPRMTAQPKSLRSSRIPVKYCRRAVQGHRRHAATNDTAHAVRAEPCQHAPMGADGRPAGHALLQQMHAGGSCLHTITAVADAVACPVIVYNVPSRTGVDISVETCRRLAASIRGSAASRRPAASTAEGCAHPERSCGDDSAALERQRRSDRSPLDGTRREGRHFRPIQRASERNDVSRWSVPASRTTTQQTPGACSAQLMGLIDAFVLRSKPDPCQAARSSWRAFPVGDCPACRSRR